MANFESAEVCARVGFVADVGLPPGSAVVRTGGDNGEATSIHGYRSADCRSFQDGGGGNLQRVARAGVNPAAFLYDSCEHSNSHYLYGVG